VSLDTCVVTYQIEGDPRVTIRYSIGPVANGVFPAVFGRGCIDNGSARDAG
jgi:hypothetical protein